jgi:hypothetical protein
MIIRSVHGLVHPLPKLTSSEAAVRFRQMPNPSVKGTGLRPAPYVER